MKTKRIVLVVSQAVLALSGAIGLQGGGGGGGGSGLSPSAISGVAATGAPITGGAAGTTGGGLQLTYLDDLFRQYWTSP